ncbi:MAG: hypothetical protein JWO62_2614 [Acidimicrobiaceae bacterium]|nr:hypothetical protein [Acidimicrobiaceae bacterium]
MNHWKQRALKSEAETVKWWNAYLDAAEERTIAQVRLIEVEHRLADVQNELNEITPGA